MLEGCSLTHSIRFVWRLCLWPANRRSSITNRMRSHLSAGVGSLSLIWHSAVTVMRSRGRKQRLKSRVFSANQFCTESGIQPPTALQIAYSSSVDDKGATSTRCMPYTVQRSDTWTQRSYRAPLSRPHFDVFVDDPDRPPTRTLAYA